MGKCCKKDCSCKPHDDVVVEEPMNEPVVTYRPPEEIVIPEMDFCENPRNTYSTARETCDHIEPPCDVANLDGDSLDEPVDEPLTPETPPCAALVYATNSDETLQEFTYVDTRSRYEAVDTDGNESGALLTFDPAIGWTVNTANGRYSTASANASPYGTYCNAINEAVTIIPCDKAVFPEPATEDPDIVRDECVEVVNYSDSNETPIQFFYNSLTDRYTAVNGDTIALDLATNLWELTTSNTTYTIEIESENPRGSYISTNNGNTASVSFCVDVAPTIPTCVMTSYATDSTVVLGNFNVNGSGDGVVPDDPAQGNFNFTSATGWTLTVGGVVYFGPTDPLNPRGLYTANNGNNVLVEDCV